MKMIRDEEGMIETYKRATTRSVCGQQSLCRGIADGQVGPVLT